MEPPTPKRRDPVGRERPASKHPRSSLRVSGTPMAHLRDVTDDTDDTERVVFNIGGRRFETTVSTLREFPKDSYIDRFLLDKSNASMREHTKDEDGSFFIDRSHATFEALLSAARRKASPRMPDGMDVSEWIADLRFWGIVHADIDNEDVLLKHQEDTARKIRSSTLTRARTIYSLFAPYIKDGSATEMVLPRYKVAKEFVADAGELPQDHAPVDSFEWWKELQDVECRRCIWNMGMRIRTTGEIKRFNAKRAPRYDLLWRMMGKIAPTKKSMFVVRYEISRKKPEEEFEEDLDTELFGARAPSAGAGRKPAQRPAQQQANAPAAAQAGPTPAADESESSGSGEDEEAPQQPARFDPGNQYLLPGYLE